MELLVGVLWHPGPQQVLPEQRWADHQRHQPGGQAPVSRTRVCDASNRRRIPTPLPVWVLTGCCPSGSPPANGEDEPRIGGVVAQFAPEVADMDVDEVVIAHPWLAPHVLDELSAAPHQAGPGRQGGENVELGACQADWVAVEENLSAAGVDGQRAERPGRLELGVGLGGRNRCAAGPSQHGADPGDEFTGLNGLVT